MRSKNTDIYSFAGCFGIDIKGEQFKGENNAELINAYIQRTATPFNIVKVYKDDFKCNCGILSKIRFVKTLNGKQASRCLTCCLALANEQEKNNMFTFIDLHNNQPVDEKYKDALLKDFNVKNINNFTKYGNYKSAVPATA